MPAMMFAYEVTVSPLDIMFWGSVPLVFMRSTWSDRNALWCGVNGGYNQVSHGHLDLGTFELEVLGIRWAIDIGADNYNLPGYWDGREGGGRWKEVLSSELRKP